MVTHKPLRLALCALLICGASTTFLSACSTPPKPKELVELERILQDPNARDVKKAPGAAKYYRQSRQYRRVSLQSYEEGNVGRAREYAILGKLRYRTAAAIKQQLEAKKRLDKANAKVAEVNPQIEALSKERNKLVDEVGEVQRKVAQARNVKAQKERRQQAMQEASLHRTDNSDQAKKVAVKNKIEAAKQAREDAITVQANEYAKGTFNRANNQLKSAIALYEGDMGSPDSIIESAGQAADLFRQAANEARPKFDAHNDKMKPAARRAALRAEARDTFGGPFTLPETHGVRIVLAMLFDKGSTTVRPASQALVKSAAELAKKYKEANLTIVGYTRKGHATENLAISNLRAKAVRDYLLTEGIKRGRMTTSGMGQDNLRYPGEPDKNDRVEIIFRIPD